MSIPKFNDTVEQIDNLRNFARHLVQIKKIALNRQAVSIDAYRSSINRGISKSRFRSQMWRQFAAAQSTSIPNDRSLLHDAWNWFHSEHPDIIRDMRPQFEPNSSPENDLGYGIYGNLAELLVGSMPRQLNLDDIFNRNYALISPDIHRDDVFEVAILRLHMNGGAIFFELFTPDNNFDQPNFGFRGVGYTSPTSLCLVGRAIQDQLCIVKVWKNIVGGFNGADGIIAGSEYHPFEKIRSFRMHEIELEGDFENIKCGTGAAEGLSYTFSLDILDIMRNFKKKAYY